MKYTICLGLLISVFGLKAQEDCACCSNNYDQFDFWEGNWAAYVADTVAGYNKIDANDSLKNPPVGHPSKANGRS